MPFPALFTPCTVGAVTLRNRVMTSAISHDLWRFDPEGYHRWNLLGRRALHFYAERARGGFALLTAGQAMVHPSCGTNRPAAYLPQCVDEYRPITEAIHDHGAKVFMQLNHNGRGRISGTDDWDPVITVRSGPSFYPGAGGELTKEIDLDELRDIQVGFARSARNMEQAGFDGVEVQAAHSYLISEFLTPAYNRRTDDYGGSLANRMRFLRETLESVREAVRSDFAVGIRLNSEWRIPDGFPLDEAVEVAATLDAAGLVDFVNVSAWGYEVSMTGIGTPHAPLAPNAARIRAAVQRAKVFVVGRIVDPGEGERIVADGQADVVALARQSIADPDWPTKAREGRVEDIITCIGASQGCIGRHYQHLPITCTQNPTVGREVEWGAARRRRADHRKRVLVAGGGPAGLEAAVIAAQRGHEVVLCEATDDLGGQIALITRSPRRRDFGLVVEWRRTQLGKLGVDVRLNTVVEPQLVDEIAPDAVVVATGSVPMTPSRPVDDHWSPSAPAPPTIPGLDGPDVLTGWDVLRGRADRCRHVVVVDEVGYYQSSDPLEYLVARGVAVTGLSPLGQFAIDMLYNDRPAFLDLIRGREVAFHPFSRLTAVEGNVVHAHDDQLGRPFVVEDVDAVVLSLGNVPRNALYHALLARVPELHRIGDCVTPRRVEHALFEGHRAAYAL